MSRNDIDGKTMYANGDKHEGKYINGKPGKPTKWGTTSDSQGIEEEVRVLKEALLVMEQPEEYENQIRLLKHKNRKARVRQVTPPSKSKKDGKRKDKKEVMNFFDDLLKK